MIYVISFVLCLILAGCTCALTMNHSEGTATDLVDETATPSTSIELPKLP